jgi:hypothetical protein
MEYRRRGRATGTALTVGILSLSSLIIYRENFRTNRCTSGRFYQSELSASFALCVFLARTRFAVELLEYFQPKDAERIHLLLNTM